MYLSEYEFTFKADDSIMCAYTMSGFLLPDGAVMIPNGSFETEDRKRKREVDAWFDSLGSVRGFNNLAGERDRCVGYFDTGERGHFYEHQIRESLETYQQIFGEIPASMAAWLEGGDNA